MRVAFSISLALSICAVAATGQTPPPAAKPGFDAVSIRPAAPNSPETFVMRQLDHGVIDLERYPLNLMLWSALRAKSFEIVGLPKWVASARYDIHAKATQPLTAEEMWPLLIPVLEDRFKLKMHRDKQEMPVYELSVSKSGKLTSVAGAKCFDPKGPLPPPVRVAAGQRPFLPCGTTLPWHGRPGSKLWGTQIQMPALISALSDLLQRPVLDLTGFTGTFDPELTFARDDSLPGLAQFPSGQATDPSGVPNIFTAIQEQLGLKLKPAKDPVEVIVIDNIEPPSEN